MTVEGVIDAALLLDTPSDFNFTGTVGAHGWRRLAPFSWDEGGQCLRRVERLCGGRVLCLSLTMTGETEPAGGGDDGHDGPRRGGRRDLQGGRLQVAWENTPGVSLSDRERDEVARRVRRMLRLDEDFTGFWRLCRRHGRRRVAQRRLGRMLRSPSVFEDLVKVMLTVNTTWPRTVTMVATLVAALGEPGPDGARTFPDPKAVAAAGEDVLRGRLRFGYRSAGVAELARRVVSGEVDLEGLLDPELPEDEVRRRLLGLRGVGPYAAASVMALLGRYGRVPVDSELQRHLADRLPAGERLTPVRAAALYESWGPWRYLGYWAELCGWND